MQRNTDLETTIVEKYAALEPLLDERTRRLWARGGILVGLLRSGRIVALTMCGVSGYMTCFGAVMFAFCSCAPPSAGEYRIRCEREQFIAYGCNEASCVSFPANCNEDTNCSCLRTSPMCSSEDADSETSCELIADSVDATLAEDPAACSETEGGIVEVQLATYDGC